jgi:hypothetical protein
MGTVLPVCPMCNKRQMICKIHCLVLAYPIFMRFYSQLSVDILDALDCCQQSTIKPAFRNTLKVLFNLLSHTIVRHNRGLIFRPPHHPKYLASILLRSAYWRM